ncbi:MAG: glycosyltransferase family 4 protein [Desulforhopalus sp.]|nr:glycosyltransferase family 4 protein [Desulforhopalus sp.]
MAVTTVYYFTNIAPHYRQRLWELLATQNDLEFHFFFGKPMAKGIVEMDFSQEFFKSKSCVLHNLINIRLKNNVIVWQIGVIRHCFRNKPDAAIFLGDMNILSTWIAAAIARLNGIRVVFWGHGFSGKESWLKRSLRITFNRLAHHHLLYGHRAMDIMKQNGFGDKTLSVIYNSLQYEQHLATRAGHGKQCKFEHLPFFKNPNLPLLVFIGRLTPAKKLNLLIEAHKRLNAEVCRYNLLIIGDGEERASLETLAGADPTVHFYGACYVEQKLSALLCLADLCVSPGNVGLTAIHCLSHGTPVCTHDNFANQMPEFEAIIPGETGFFFRENDAEDLAGRILDWSVKDVLRDVVRHKCYRVIDEKYNPYYQLTVFKKVLSK